MEYSEMQKKAEVLQQGIIDDCRTMSLSPNDAAFILIGFLASLAVAGECHPRDMIVSTLDSQIAGLKKLGGQKSG